MNTEQLKKLYRKRRRSAFFLMLFAALAAIYALSAVIYLEPLTLLYVAVCAALALWALRRGRRYTTPQPAPETMDDARALYDRTHRRAFSWLFADALLVAWIIYGALSLSVNNSKPQELLEFFQSNVTIFGALAIGLGVNLMMARWTGVYGAPGWHGRFRRYFLLCAAISLAYWGALLWLFGTFNTASFFTFFAAAGVYGLLALAFNVRLRGRVLHKNFTFSPIRLGIGIGVVALLAIYLLLQRDVWLTQPWINRVPNVSERRVEVAYDDDSGVYTLTNPGGDFRVLQLTDIHLGGSFSSYNNDLKALKACFALIDHTRPDLVVVTGDLCYPMGLASFSLNNTAPVMQFAAFMRNTGIPWAFT